MSKRILVVDDEPAMGHVFRCALREYEVHFENDPKAAIDTAKEFRPDVFLLDLVMPDIPGNILAENIMREPGLEKVPIIFVSAVVHTRDQVEEPVWIGPFPAFGKPFCIHALRRCIARQIGVDSTDCGEVLKRRCVGGP
jgi:two-component system OmpR family response regulator